MFRPTIPARNACGAPLVRCLQCQADFYSAMQRIAVLEERRNLGFICPKSAQARQLALIKMTSCCPPAKIDLKRFMEADDIAYSKKR